MPGFKRGPDGHVSLTKIADGLHVDRRVLKQLYERRELVGVRAGGVLGSSASPSPHTCGRGRAVSARTAAAG